MRLYVGGKRKELAVHKKMLCDQVEYFAEKLNGESLEAKTGAMVSKICLQ
jgi:hypothetical protein